MQLLKNFKESNIKLTALFLNLVYLVSGLIVNKIHNITWIRLFLFNSTVLFQVQNSQVRSRSIFPSCFFHLFFAINSCNWAFCFCKSYFRLWIISFFCCIINWVVVESWSRHLTYLYLWGWERGSHPSPLPCTQLSPYQPSVDSLYPDYSSDHHRAQSIARHLVCLTA